MGWYTSTLRSLMASLGTGIFLCNWAALADGVCSGLWKHDLHPEFRRTVKLSLAACLGCLFDCRGLASMMKSQRSMALSGKWGGFWWEKEDFLITGCRFGIARKDYLAMLQARKRTLNIELPFYMEKYIFNTAAVGNCLFQISPGMIYMEHLI